MNSTPRVGALIAVMAALALSACTGTSQPTQTTTGPSPSPSASTSTTVAQSTTSLSPQELEAKAAEAAVVKFWRVVDELSADPNTSLDKLATVSRGTSIDTWAQMLTNRRGKQYRQVGDVVVASVAAKVKGPKSWGVTACIDVSKVNLVDKDGKSVVAATRPPRVEYLYTVEKGQNPEGYYVIADKQVRTC